jgi:hypothetical protein
VREGGRERERRRRRRRRSCSIIDDDAVERRGREALREEAREG